MAALPLKSFCTEERAIVRFLWAEGHNANAIHSEMRPVHGAVCLSDSKLQYETNKRDFLT